MPPLVAAGMIRASFYCVAIRRKERFPEMASRNFYYRKLAEAVSGSADFAAYLAAHFAAVGLTSAQQVAYGLVDTALQDAFSASNSPATRTSVTVEATRVALRNMRAAAVPLAQQIVGNPAVDDSELVAMGLLPRSGRTPSTLITVAPVLTIAEILGRNVRVRVRGAATGSRGKLPGADGAVIFSYVGATPPDGAAGWTSEGPITKDSAIIAFDDEVPVGAKVWFAAQWFNSKGVGPGCTPVAAVIGAEGSLAA
jgi:hypothetical protein